METNVRALPSQDNRRSYDGHYMKVGMHAEEIVMAWLKDHPQVVGLEDLRSLRPMREADIDASVRLHDGRIVLAEIKSDYHLGLSGNVLFEALRINHTCAPGNACTLGWSARSPATWLLFYAPRVNAVYRFLFQDYRQVMQAFTRENEPKIIVVRTDNIKTTINILIPEKYFEGRMHKYLLHEKEDT